MKNTSTKTLMLFVILTAIFLFPNPNAWAWGSRDSSSGSYGSSRDRSSSSSESSSNYYSSDDSGWGSSGSSRDGSTSWSYSDSRSSISEDFCRKCHGNLARFPSLRYENPDKHHLLIDQRIPPNSIAPNDTPGDLYECSTCHSVETTVDGLFEIKVTRDCLKCHPIDTVTGPPWRSNNVHHRTGIRNCNTCHSVIGWGWGR